jgi:hypothetical protein
MAAHFAEPAWYSEGKSGRLHKSIPRISAVDDRSRREIHAVGFCFRSRTIREVVGKWEADAFDRYVVLAEKRALFTSIFFHKIHWRPFVS